jgi:hypothetical protein
VRIRKKRWKDVYDMYELYWLDASGAFNEPGGTGDGKDYGSWGNLASQGYRYRETIGDFKGNTWYLFERKVKQ